MAGLGYTLKQEPVTLGSYDPTQTQVAQLSHNGRFFGQVDSWGNARVWLLDNPATPSLELLGEPSRGHIFVNVIFSADGKYIIFDSVIKNTHLPTRGRIIVVSTSNLQQQSFDTFIWGGAGRSKWALSNTGLLAYVPLDNGEHIEIIDLITKKQSRIIERGLSSIVALAFDPTAQKMATKDISANAIRIRDVNTGILLKRLDLSFPMPDDAGSPNQTLFYWGEGTMLAVNSDLNQFAVGFDAKTGGGQFPFMWFAPLAMFHSNNTSMLAIADANFNLNVQKLNDPMLYVLVPFGYFNFVVAGAFSPSDRVFVVGSTQGQVALYDASLNFQTGATLSIADQILQLAFANEQKFYSLTTANALTRWDISTLTK